MAERPDYPQQAQEAEELSPKHKELTPPKTTSPPKPLTRYRKHSPKKLPIYKPQRKEYREDAKEMIKKKELSLKYTDPCKMYLIGTESAGKESFVQLLKTHSHFKESDYLRAVHSLIERGKEVKERRRLDLQAHGVLLSDDFQVQLIDVPPFPEEGYESEPEPEPEEGSSTTLIPHGTGAIVEKVIERIMDDEYITCVCLLVNGLEEYVTDSLECFLGEISQSGILSSPLNDNFFVVFTGVGSPSELKLEAEKLDKYFDGEVKKLCINSPLWVDTRRGKTLTAGSMSLCPGYEHLSIQYKMEFEGCIKVLEEMFKVVRTYKEVYTVEFLKLYQKWEDMERKFLANLMFCSNETKMLKAIRKLKQVVELALEKYAKGKTGTPQDKEIEKELVERMKEHFEIELRDLQTIQEDKEGSEGSRSYTSLLDTNINELSETNLITELGLGPQLSPYYNTVCIFPSCYKNCHLECGEVEKPFLKQSSLKSCVCMSGTDVCTGCGHTYQYHYHNVVQIGTNTETILNQEDILEGPKEDLEGKDLLEGPKEFEETLQIVREGLESKEKEVKELVRESFKGIREILEEASSHSCTKEGCRGCRRKVYWLENALFVVEEYMEGADEEEKGHWKEIVQHIDKVLNQSLSAVGVEYV